jgi:PKD repeat protein
MIKGLATFSALAAAVAMAACTVHQSDTAPAPTGPSDFAQSISITSNPDRLTQDGQSQSAITITVFDATGSPSSGVPIRVDMLVGGTLVDFGRLSARNVVTLSNGRATVVYTAPAAPPPLSSDTTTTVTIRAIAVGTNAVASNPFSTDIRLVPPGVILPPADTPTASFTVSPSPASANVPLNFDASSSIPGTGATSIISYAWTFGDGSSASGRTVAKTFTAPGTFNVTLTVTNDRGLASSTTQAVSVGTTALPTASFTFSPASPAINQAVNFNAAASSAAPGRSIASYSWNFGDGSATKGGVTAQHDFGVVGAYSVTLIVTDDVGQRSTATQTVTVAGGGAGGTTARFTFSPSGPTTLQSVFFNASTSTAATGHTLTTFAWDFGDGSIGSGVSVSHSFAAAGTFTVTLTVTDDIGQKSTATQAVPVTSGGGGAPTAAFTFSPAAPGVGESVFFNASTSTAGPGRTLVAYNWTFGDGAIGTGVSVSHPYSTAGTYSVQLTVTDNGTPPQSVTSAPTPITVGNPPSPTARFTVSPTNPVVDQLVTFDAGGSTTGQGQSITKYEWNFGDSTPIITCPGNPACGPTNRTISHQFATAQTFTINLVVTDTATRTGATQNTLTVLTANPTARLTLTKAGAFTINADGSASSATGTSTIVTYSFNWGDGTGSTTGSSSQASHTYVGAIPGSSFTVVLTVTDNNPGPPSGSGPRSGTTSQSITLP